MKRLYETHEELAIEDIETVYVYSETREYCLAIGLTLDRLPDDRVVPKDLRIPIGNTRCSSRSESDRHDGLRTDLIESENLE